MSYENYCNKAREIALQIGNREIVELMDKALSLFDFKNFVQFPVVETGVLSFASYNSNCKHINTRNAGAGCIACDDCGAPCISHSSWRL